YSPSTRDSFTLRSQFCHDWVLGCKCSHPAQLGHEEDAPADGSLVPKLNGYWPSAQPTTLAHRLDRLQGNYGRLTVSRDDQGRPLEGHMRQPEGIPIKEARASHRRSKENPLERVGDSLTGCVTKALVAEVERNQRCRRESTYPKERDDLQQAGLSRRD